MSGADWRADLPLRLRYDESLRKERRAARILAADGRATLTLAQFILFRVEGPQ